MDFRLKYLMDYLAGRAAFEISGNVYKSGEIASCSFVVVEEVLHEFKLLLEEI